MKALVAFFSASGSTAKLARTLASAAGAELYEIRPAVPYERRDLNWMDKKSRTTVEMQDPFCRPALADADAPLAEAERLADTASGPPGDTLLQELVEHLQPDDRQLLQERFDGYSNIEIAQHHGLKPNTLNKRMSRIVEKLKEIYTQLYEHEP